jgi:hypothetical protein
MRRFAARFGFLGARSFTGWPRPHGSAPKAKVSRNEPPSRNELEDLRSADFFRHRLEIALLVVLMIAVFALFWFDLQRAP